MKAVKIIFLINCVFLVNLFAQDNKEKTTTDNEPKITVVKEKKEAVESEINKLPLEKFDNTDAVKIDKSMIPIVSRQGSNEKYRIGFQDVLTIAVYRHPELSQTVSVGQDGTIFLPRINEPIVAVCKTERELANLITELYKNYLRNPFVNVSTQEQRSQPFAVMGAVNKPGNFFLNQRIRLLSLLSLAGGQDVEKAGSRVQVARVGNVSNCSQGDDSDSDIKFFEYTLNNVLSGKENPWMQPGDIVSVLEAQQAYVIGEVVEPSKITLKEPITLSEALAYAGGVNSTAKLSQVVIQRKENDNGIRTELVFDMKAIRANEAPDPVLQANDIVVVSSSTAKKVKKGLWDLIIKGLPNIFYRIPL